MFTTQPEAFGSLYNSQIFDFESTFIEDHTYVIKEVYSGDTIAVKKFYRTNTAAVNIAPIVRSFAIPKPLFSVKEFLTDLNFGRVTIQLSRTGSVEEDAVLSSVRTFSLSKQSEKKSALLTTMPKRRYLSSGESDLLLIKHDEDSSVKITVGQFKYRSDAGSVTSADASQEYEYEGDGDGFSLFSIDAEPYEGLEQNEIERVEVKIYSKSLANSESETPIYETQLIDCVEYFIIDPPRNPTRLVWVSSRGSLEHYTMPFMVSESSSSDGTHSYMLRSALEDYETRRAIAEIASSPVVWLVVGEEYVEMQIERSEIELSPDRDVATVEFKISYSD